MWAQSDPDEVRLVWADELGVFDGEDIRAALDALRATHKDYPPTLFQFVDLCRDSRRRRVAATLKLDAPRTEMPEGVRQALREFVSKHTVRDAPL